VTKQIHTYKEKKDKAKMDQWEEHTLWLLFLLCPAEGHNVTLPSSLPGGVGIGQSVWPRAGQPGFDSRHGKNFLFSIASKPDSGAHPTSYVMGFQGLFPRGVKREANNSPPSSAEGKEGRSYTSTPTCLHAHNAYIIKYRDKFLLPTL
jgi:hypothetical protein